MHYVNPKRLGAMLHHVAEHRSGGTSIHDTHSVSPKRLSALLLLGGLLLGGCAPSQVMPWEKGTLADEVMKPGGPASLKKINDHVYTSKEAAKGGGGVGGGGCGCS